MDYIEQMYPGRVHINVHHSEPEMSEVELKALCRAIPLEEFADAAAGYSFVDDRLYHQMTTEVRRHLRAVFPNAAVHVRRIR